MGKESENEQVKEGTIAKERMDCWDTAEFLNQLRERHGMTQAAVAEQRGWIKRGETNRGA
jgi:hypothetical protein